MDGIPNTDAISLNEKETEKIVADYLFFSYLKKNDELEGEDEAKVQKDAAIDMSIEMGEYDMDQEPDVNIPRLTTPPLPILMPDTYWHEGECFPSEWKCLYCYKYWCGKCGNGVSSYLSGCCSNN